MSHCTATSQPQTKRGVGRRYDDRMTAEYYPLQVLLLALSGWVNREQQRTIEYLVEENRVLKGNHSIDRTPALTSVCVLRRSEPTVARPRPDYASGSSLRATRHARGVSSAGSAFAASRGRTSRK